MSAKLPDLPYAYDALEPHISKTIMLLHHSKHHQTYVNNYNAASEKLAAAVAANDVKQQIALQAAIKFNGGGHINHSLFWTNMAPQSEGGGKVPASGAFREAIDKKYGSPEGLIKEFNTALAGIQGSGWGWLVKEPSGELEILTTPNQDPVTNAVPLIGVDAWEHAYYIQYQNNKAQYFQAIWNVINWAEAEKRFSA